MHSLAVVLIPLKYETANIRSPIARQAAAQAKVDILMLRYEQPDGRAWGVSVDHGFTCDWWVIGGRWNAWGRHVRRLMRTQRIAASSAPIPRSLEPNAVWCEDLARVRSLGPGLFPVALVTPYGDWLEADTVLFGALGNLSARERKGRTAWRRKVRTMVQRWPECLAVAVDYHW